MICYVDTVNHKSDLEIEPLLCCGIVAFSTNTFLQVASALTVTTVVFALSPPSSH
jgi:hypothetical protein